MIHIQSVQVYLTLKGASFIKLVDTLVGVVDLIQQQEASNSTLALANPVLSGQVKGEKGFLKGGLEKLVNI